MFVNLAIIIFVLERNSPLLKNSRAVQTEAASLSSAATRSTLSA